MKIIKSKIYKINLQEEMPGHLARENHTIINYGCLEFSGRELLLAIMYMGMLPHTICSSKRRSEVDFKISVVQTVLKEDLRGADTWLVLDRTTFDYFDSSEKSAFSYWLGMIFSTLLARKYYSYKYVMHYEAFSKSPLCTGITPVAGTGSAIPVRSKSKPDLVASNSLMNEFGIFEAKGRQIYTENAMQKAYDQVKRIGYVNGIRVQRNIASIFIIDPSDVTIRFKDPIGEEGLTFNPYVAFIWQCLPIFELLKEMQTINENDYIISESFESKEVDSFKVRMNESLYGLCEIISESKSGEYNRNIVTEVFEEKILNSDVLLEIL